MSNLQAQKPKKPPCNKKRVTLTESLPTETSEDTAIEQEVMKSVPKVYKTGARQLLGKIKDNRDVLHWNNKGELLYEDKEISGSHLVDLVNDILRHRKGFEPVGWSVFARGLARMNVPENLVPNPQRQSAVREFKTRLKDANQPTFTLAANPNPTLYISSYEKEKENSSKSTSSGCSLASLINHDKKRFSL